MENKDTRKKDGWVDQHILICLVNSFGKCMVNLNFVINFKFFNISIMQN